MNLRPADIQKLKNKAEIVTVQQINNLTIPQLRTILGYSKLDVSNPALENIKAKMLKWRRARERQIIAQQFRDKVDIPEIRSMFPDIKFGMEDVNEKLRIEIWPEGKPERGII